MEPRPAEQYVVAGLRIDDLEGVSGSNRPYSKVEVYKPEGVGLMASEAQDFVRLSNDLLSRNANCIQSRQGYDVDRGSLVEHGSLELDSIDNSRHIEAYCGWSGDSVGRCSRRQLHCHRIDLFALTFPRPNHSSRLGDCQSLL